MFIILENMASKNDYFTTGFGRNNEPTPITKYKTYKEAEKFVSERLNSPQWQDTTFVIFQETCKIKANVNVELIRIKDK
jgi:hypothetical protein